MAVVTHYDTLKITCEAPPALISAAYKALAHKYHPDKNIGNDEAVRMMQLINASYRVLNDAAKKAEHDAWIKAQTPPKVEPVLTAEEQALKNKYDQYLAEAKKWADWCAKINAEAKSARDKANKAQDQLRGAPPAQHGAFSALFEREDGIAKEVEKKAMDAQKQHDAAAAEARRHYFSKRPKEIATLYDALKVTRDAPFEVLQAAAKALADDAGAQSAFSILSDASKKAEHDAWIYKNCPHLVAAAQNGGEKPQRKSTGRELNAKAIAEKCTADASALEAWAEQAAAQAKASQVKADKAAHDASVASEEDAEKWKKYAAKLQADATTEKNRAEQAKQKATEARIRATQAQTELKDAQAAAEKDASLMGH
jgi:DnaJ-class molecular chaperone